MKLERTDKIALQNYVIELKVVSADCPKPLIAEIMRGIKKLQAEVDI